MRITVILILFILSNTIFSQTKTQVFEAIKKLDMAALSEMFDRKIEYCFDDQIEFLDKAAALKAVKAFLDRNTPKSMTPMHQGSSKSEDSNFAIAIMESTSGRKYRIYVYAENSGGKLLVKELRIDIQK